MERKIKSQKMSKDSSFALLNVAVLAYSKLSKKEILKILIKEFGKDGTISLLKRFLKIK